MHLFLIHLRTIETDETVLEVKVLHLEPRNFTDAQAVVEEEARQQPVAPPLRGIGMSMLQSMRFHRRQRYPLFFLGANAGGNVVALALVVDVLAPA